MAKKTSIRGMLPCFAMACTRNREWSVKSIASIKRRNLQWQTSCTWHPRSRRRERHKEPAFYRGPSRPRSIPWQVLHNAKPSSNMPSIPVQIRAPACSRRQAPVPTVIRLRLLDHTLDGIIDVVGLGFLLNFNLRHLLLAAFRQKRKRG